MSLLMDDLAWAWRMLQARRIRRGLIFSRRKAYDDALRPSAGSSIIGYPDAFYYVQKHDMMRAATLAERLRPTE
jgi:hypothetical protein